MAQGMIQPFSPTTTVSVSASTTSANSALGTTNGGNSVLIYNSTGSIAFVQFGTDLTVTATASSFPIPAGGTRLLSIGSIVSTVAVILATGSGTVYLARGNGTAY